MPSSILLPFLRRWLGLGVIAILIGSLEFAVRFGMVNAALVPTPSSILIRVTEIITSGAFVDPLSSTLYLFFSAYFSACILGISAGLAMGRFPAVFRLLEPTLELIRPLPKPALLPALILFLGIGDQMKYVSVLLAAFFPILLNTIQGVRGVDPVLINTARTFGRSPTAILLRVVFPASMPLIFAGMRIAVAVGLILVVAAEMMAGTGGLGYLIIDMQRSFLIPQMYAWLVILACLGYGLNLLFLSIEARVLHWATSSAE